MEIKKKCDIIEEFMREYTFGTIFLEDEDIKYFISYNNLGIPLAQCVSYSLADPTPEGFLLIEETWESLCSLLDVRVDGDYEDLDEFLEEGE